MLIVAPSGSTKEDTSLDAPIFSTHSILIGSVPTDEELENLMLNPGIIRNRSKIFSVRKNAQAVKKIQAQYGSFDAYLWNFTGNNVIDGHWKTVEQIPTVSDVSRKMALDMKKKGIAFVGPVITYSFLQSIGMVNDHLEDCKYRDC